MPLVVLGALNLERGTVPDGLTLPGVAAGVAFSFFDPRIAWTGSVVGAVVGAGVLYAAAWLYRTMDSRHREGMGSGNVKLMAMVGAFLGWQEVLLTLVLGSGLAFLGGLVNRRTWGRWVPFATFLAAAAVGTAWFGDPFLEWYGGFLE